MGTRKVALSRAELSREVAILKRDNGRLVLLMSLAMQHIQKLYATNTDAGHLTGYTVSSRSRLSRDRISLDTTVVAPSNFPIPSLDSLMDSLNLTSTLVGTMV